MEQPSNVELPSPPAVRRPEWIVVIVVAIVAVAWSLWPTLRGLQQTPVNSHYLYTNVPDTSDTQIYFAFIDQNAAGHVLYKNLFTSEAQRAVLFNPLWLVLGTIERVTNQSPEAVFTASRLVFGVGLIVLLYWFIAHLIQAPRWRITALLLTVFGGGFGGIFYLFRSGDPRMVWIQTQTPLLQSLPVDVTHAAAFTWQTIGHSPLFIVAQLLLLGTWLIIWRGGRTWLAMILAGLLAFIHPYDPVLLIGVLAGQLVFKIMRSAITPGIARLRLRAIGWLVVAMIPAGLYYLWAVTTEPIIRQWFQQNILFSPTITSLVAGFGVVGILAVIAALRRPKSSTQHLLVDWLVASLFLSYIPLISFQAKMLSLINVPIAILATLGLQQIWKKFVQRKVLLTIGSCLAAAVTFSSVIIFPVRVAKSQTVEPIYHYASNDLPATLEWVKTATPADSIILGDYFTDNLVPRYARRTAYIGHNLQTIHFQSKLRLVREWFYGTSGQVNDKEGFLHQAHINFVVWGPSEKIRGPFQPTELSSLTLVHQLGEVSVYVVKN